MTRMIKMVIMIKTIMLMIIGTKRIIILMIVRIMIKKKKKNVLHTHNSSGSVQHVSGKVTFAMTYVVKTNLTPYRINLPAPPTPHPHTPYFFRLNIQSNLPLSVRVYLEK